MSGAGQSRKTSSGKGRQNRSFHTKAQQFGASRGKLLKNWRRSTDQIAGSWDLWGMTCTWCDRKLVLRLFGTRVWRPTIRRLRYFRASAGSASLQQYDKGPPARAAPSRGGLCVVVVRVPIISSPTISGRDAKNGQFSWSIFSYTTIKSRRGYNIAYHGYVEPAHTLLATNHLKFVCVFFLQYREKGREIK